MQFPNMEPVASSNVAAIGYEAETCTLFVRFNDGSLYKYDDVSLETYRSFISASSKGRFVWRQLRDKYPYSRIG